MHDHESRIADLRRRIKELQHELRREREALVALQDQRDKLKSDAAKAEKQTCWQWRLITHCRYADTSVAMAQRDVAMAYKWLQGSRLSDLGREYGISGSRVKSACVRVVVQALRATEPEKARPYAFTMEEGLAALQAAERAFNAAGKAHPEGASP